MRSGLSVCMIVRNETTVLDRCLRSLEGVYDELVIVDTGSNDDTVEIAQRFTDAVYHCKWSDDFSQARNTAQKYVRYSHTLTWDADYVLVDSSSARLKERKNDLNGVDCAFLLWHAEMDGLSPTRSLLRGMIYDSQKWTWRYPVHNQLHWQAEGTPHQVEWSDIEVQHHKEKNIKSHRYRQTSRIIEQYLSDHPQDNRMRTMYANGLQFDGRYSQAESEYRRVIENTQGLCGDAWYALLEQYIRCLVQQGKVQEAKEFLNYHIVQNPPNLRLYVWQADFAYLDTDYSTAMQYYTWCVDHPLVLDFNTGMIDRNRHIKYPQMMVQKLSSIH